MSACPYCARAMGALALREHVAVNKCRRCPPGACVPFSGDELLEVAEDDYRKMAERVARKLGWLVSHVERARAGRDGRWMTSAAPGFPDDWFVHPSGVLIVVEFKRQKHKTKPELAAKQAEWLDAVANVPGALALRGLPSHWPVLQRALTSVTNPR